MAVLIRYFDMRTESSILGEIINLFHRKFQGNSIFGILLYSLPKLA
ncbi:hypothetical protein HMPREF1552_02455 [Leptotrichia sp. oral taxon 879 str. F0557]|nr:hypothetical protein HMPREF1552_02455 [Leptotrichia sp. oral taxon 879 str. F0557]